MDNQNVNPNVNPNPGAKPNYDIHVMPDKFYINQPPKKKSKWWLILLIVLIVIIIILGGVYFLSQRVTAPTVNVNTNVANENVNMPDVNLNENLNEAPLNLNEADLLNLNENTNIAPVFNETTEVGVTLESSADADKDGLTDVEEELYQTEVNKPDTDLDGYLDGAEVVDGYNPKQASGAKLADSGLVNLYTNNLLKYTVLYLSSWLAKPVDSSLQSVIFQSANGEYLQVLVENNDQKLGVLEWFLTQSPSSDPNKLKPFTSKSGLVGIISEDGLTYYLAPAEDTSKIYVVTYNVGTKTELNFLTTFKMMINSLTLQP